MSYKEYFIRQSKWSVLCFIGNSIPWIKLWKINAFFDLLGTKKAGVKASL